MNRRDALTIAGAGLAAALVPTAAPAQASRLAELTADYEAALKAFHDAIDAEEEAEAEFKSLTKDKIFSPSIMGKSYVLRGDDAEAIRDDLYAIVDKEAGIAGVTFALTGGDPLPLKHWKRRMRAGIRKSVAEWEGHREACGLAAASAARDRCSDAEREALLDLLAYRPISPEDARAKVEVLGPLNRKGNFEGMIGAVEALLESMLPEGEDLPDEFYGWAYHRSEGGAS